MAAGKPVILVARSTQDATEDAARLQAARIEAVAVPVLDPVYLDEAGLPADCQGVIYTSRFAVRPAHVKGGLPAFCVGSGSAKKARQAGFGQVYHGNAGGRQLAELIIAHTAAGDGPLFWPHGSDIAVDMAGLLAGAGYNVTSCQNYQMVRADQLDPAVAALVSSERDLALLVASAGQLAGFAELLKQGGLWHCAKKLVLLAGSVRTAQATDNVWRSVQVAKAAGHSALLALAEDWTRQISQTGNQTI